MDNRGYILVADSPFIPETDGGQRETSGIVLAARRANVLDCLIVYASESQAFEREVYEEVFGCPVYLAERSYRPWSYVNPMRPFISASRPVPVDAIASLRRRGARGVVACSFKVAHVARALATALELPFAIREHNLESHYYRELARSTAGLRRAYLGWEASRIGVLQKRIYGDRHLVCVADISRTDGDLRDTSPHVRKLVVPPLALRPQIKVKRDIDPLTVLFVGNLSVETNELAVRWFLDQCWSALRDRVCGVRLFVVGRRPRAQFDAYLANQESLERHYDVADIEPFYERSAVAINPIKSGSGVNIKLVDYMNRAVPTVTTMGPARALGADHTMVEIADGPLDFANAVASLLNNPTAAQGRAERGREWLSETQTASASEELWATLETTE